MAIAERRATVAWEEQRNPFCKGAILYWGLKQGPMVVCTIQVDLCWLLLQSIISVESQREPSAMNFPTV